MPSTPYFDDFYGVTKENALNFWATNLRETIGDRRWSRIQDSVGLYLVSILAHFCLTSVDRQAILSSDYNPTEQELRQFADLAQIAELKLLQFTCPLAGVGSPTWMESAGAHILLYAGFFRSQNQGRHNIDFFSKMGKDFYYMAAVGERERIMKMVAGGFDGYLTCLTRLNQHLREKRYLINVEH